MDCRKAIAIPKRAQEMMQGAEGTEDYLCSSRYEENINKIDKEYKIHTARNDIVCASQAQVFCPCNQYPGKNDNKHQPAMVNPYNTHKFHSEYSTKSTGAACPCAATPTEELGTSSDAQSFGVDLELADKCMNTAPPSKVTELFEMKKRSIEAQMRSLIHQMKGNNGASESYQERRQNELRKRCKLQQWALQTCRNTQRIEYEIAAIRSQISKTFAKCSNKYGNNFCCKAQMDRICALQDQLEHIRAEGVRKEFDLQMSTEAEERLVKGNEILKGDIKVVLGHAQVCAREIARMQHDILNDGTLSSKSTDKLATADSSCSKSSSTSSACASSSITSASSINYPECPQKNVPPSASSTTQCPTPSEYEEDLKDCTPGAPGGFSKPLTTSGNIVKFGSSQGETEEEKEDVTGQNQQDAPNTNLPQEQGDPVSEVLAAPLLNASTYQQTRSSSDEESPNSGCKSCHDKNNTSSKTESTLYEGMTLPRISEESDVEETVVKFHEGVVPMSLKPAPNSNDVEILRSYQTQNINLTEVVNKLTEQLNSTQYQLENYRNNQDQLIIDRTRAEDLTEQIEVLREQNEVLVQKIEKGNKVLLQRAAANDAKTDLSGPSDGFKLSDGKLLPATCFQYASRIENLEILISNLSMENESNFQDYLESKNILANYKKDIKRCLQELAKSAETFQLLGEPTESAGQRNWAEFSKKALQVARAAKQASERQELAMKVMQKERDALLSENDALRRKLDIYAAVQKQFLNTYFGPELKSRVDELTKEVSLHKSQTQQLEAEKMELSNKYEHVLEDHTNSINRIQELERKLKTVTQSYGLDVVKLKDEINRLLAEIGSKEGAEKKLTEQTMNSIQTIKDYKFKLEKYQSDLEAARDVIEKLIDTNDAYRSHASSTEAVLHIDNGFTSKNIFLSDNSSQYVPQESSFAQVVQYRQTSPPEKHLSTPKTTSPFGEDNFRSGLAKIRNSLGARRNLSKYQGEDPRLQVICSKILERGLDALDLKALVYLHYAVYNAGAKFRRDLGPSDITRESSLKKGPLRIKHNEAKAVKLYQIERDMNKTQEILKYLQRHTKSLI